MNLFFYYYNFLKNVSYLNAILCFRSLSVSSYALLLFIFMAVHLKRAKKKIQLKLSWLYELHNTGLRI